MGKPETSNSLKAALGKRVYQLRKLNGLTQEALGEKSGLSYKFVGEIERGAVNVSIDSLFKIAQALGIQVSDLFHNNSDLSRIKIKNKVNARDQKVLRRAIDILSSQVDQ